METDRQADGDDNNTPLARTAEGLRAAPGMKWQQNRAIEVPLECQTDASIRAILRRWQLSKIESAGIKRNKVRTIL